LAELKRLCELQAIDSAIDGLRRRRADLEREAAAEEEHIRLAGEELEAARTNSHDLRRVVDKKELELKRVEEKIRVLQGQLNRVKTNREFTALQHEIAGFKADASLLEDESLQMLERTDIARQRIADAEATLAEAEKSCVAHREAIRARQEKVDQEIGTLLQQRSAPLAEVNRSHREMYEQLRTRSDGMAVVAARNGVCQGCFMNLTSNTVNLLMGGDELIRCHSCGRILFLDDQDD